jgi:hypothetical protein
MRSMPFSFLALSTIVLATSAARADVMGPPTGAAAAHHACVDKDVGGACETEDGGPGTCVVLQGTLGTSFSLLVCLNAAEAERGRREGWIAERAALAALVGLLSVAVVGAGMARRRKSGALPDALPQVRREPLP